MEDFLRLLAKKAKEQGGIRQDKHMEAKATMAKELSDVLGGDLLEDMKGLKKVTVASNSPEGLKKGLEKAEDMLSRKMSVEDSEDEDMEESEDEREEEESEEREEEVEDSEDTTEIEETEDEIAALEEQIRQLKSKKR